MGLLAVVILRAVDVPAPNRMRIEFHRRDRWFHPKVLVASGERYPVTLERNRMPAIGALASIGLDDFSFNRCSLRILGLVLLGSLSRLGAL